MPSRPPQSRVKASRPHKLLQAEASTACQNETLVSGAENRPLPP